MGASANCDHFSTPSSKNTPFHAVNERVLEQRRRYWQQNKKGSDSLGLEFLVSSGEGDMAKASEPTAKMVKEIIEFSNTGDDEKTPKPKRSFGSLVNPEFQASAEILFGHLVTSLVWSATEAGARRYKGEVVPPSSLIGSDKDHIDGLQLLDPHNLEYLLLKDARQQQAALRIGAFLTKTNKPKAVGAHPTPSL